MLYLLLAVLCVVANSLIFRVSEPYIKSHFGMLLGNYIVCVALALMHLYPAPFVPRAEGLGLTAGLGIFNGLIYLAGFAMIQYNTRIHGVVLTTIFSRLGVLVPTLLSVTVFREAPTAIQLVGFLLALCAILLMNTEKSGGLSVVRPALMIMLLLNGSCDSMAKVYDQVGVPALQEHFLTYSFLAALVYNLLLLLWRRERPRTADLLFGFVLGIPNYYVARFLLKAVGAVPAIIVYPTFSVGSLLLTAVAGVLLFRETVSRRQGAAMAVILAALVFLNL